MSTISAVASAVPGEPVPQAMIMELAMTQVAQRAPALLEHASVFQHTEIETRHFVRPVDWYLADHGWKARMEAFESGGLELVETSLLRLFDELTNTWGRTVGPTDVDGIVFVTTTGMSAPSLDALVAERIGMRSDLERIPVWGLGCAGGVAGLRIANAQARARPGSLWVVVALELCSLACRPHDTSVRALVANALFSDGCAAVAIRHDPDEATDMRLPHIERTQTHRWPDSRDIMGWDIEDDGFSVVFSRRIPELLRTGLGAAIGSIGDATPVLHPGGPKVLDAYQEALGLQAKDLAISQDVLRRYGNMSSPTVLFVLEETIRSQRAASPGRYLMGAVGPGFSAEMAWLTTERP